MLRLAPFAAALALAAASAAPAMATVVNDPDEPGVAQSLDIEWAGAGRLFVPGTGWLYTHTVKTRAPYAARPCVFIRVGGTVNYRLCGTWLQSGGSKWPITMTENAALDTVSYTFNLAQIGNPKSYEWVARTWLWPIADFAPDAGWAVYPQPNTITNPPVVIGGAATSQKPWTEPDPREDHPRPGLGDIPDCIKC